MKIKKRHLKRLIERYLFEEESESKEKDEEKIEKLDYQENPSNPKQTTGNEFRELYKMLKDDKVADDTAYELTNSAAKILDIEEKNGKFTIAKKDIEKKLKDNNNEIRPYTTA